MRQLAKRAVRCLSAPFVRHIPVRWWPKVFGRIHGIEVPSGIRPNRNPQACGAVNIRILLEHLDRTASLPSSIAECGVYRGGTLAAMALYLKQARSCRRIYGFDSFEGFGPVVNRDIELYGEDRNRWMRSDAFSDTSLEIVQHKLRRLGLKNAHLIKGYFAESLRTLPSVTFSFVHLDCDLSESYRVCLEHFFPRLDHGGIIAFDEYNDPSWPGCTQAVDEFLADKEEVLQSITRDNQIKYYLVKGETVSACRVQNRIAMPQADL